MNIVIVGGMKKAEFLLQSLLTKNHHVKIIHDDLEYCKWISRNYDVSVYCGDGSKHYILDEAEIENFDLLIAMTPQDEDNLVICQLSKKLYGVRKTFATVSNPQNVELFKALGIDNVISSAYYVSRIIEEMALKNDLATSIKMEASGIGIFEVQLKKDYPVCGKPIHLIPLPDKTLIAYIIRGRHYIVPTGKTLMLNDDRVIFICPKNDSTHVMEIITGGDSHANSQHS